MKETIFLIDSNDQLIEFSETAYDREDLLQQMLSDYPKPLAGSQIDPAEPRRRILVSRELGVAGEENGANRCLNVEVTVTGQRGWVNESKKSLAADMTVEGKTWLSPEQGEAGKMLWLLLQTFNKEFPLPIDKKHAIRVVTHKPGNADEPIFPLRDGESDPALFPIPSFAKHPEA